MKKLVFISLVLGIVSASLFAGKIEGKIATIEEGKWGTLIVLNKTGGGQTSAFPLDDREAEKHKRLLTLALTAKASANTVDIVSNVIGGRAMVETITLK